MSNNYTTSTNSTATFVNKPLINPIKPKVVDTTPPPIANKPLSNPIKSSTCQITTTKPNTTTTTTPTTAPTKPNTTTTTTTAPTKPNTTTNTAPTKPNYNITTTTTTTTTTTPNITTTINKPNNSIPIQLSAKDRFKSRTASQPTTQPTTTSQPSSQPTVSAKDRFKNRTDDFTTPTIATTTVSAKDRFKSRNQDYGQDDDDYEKPIKIDSSAPSLYATTTASNALYNMTFDQKQTEYNFYSTKKMTRNKKIVNKPDNPATNVAELKIMMDNGCISVMGKYQGYENDKYLIDIEREMGLFIVEYTKKLCENLKEQNPSGTIFTPVDKKNPCRLRVAELPVISETYMLNNEYNFIFSVTKPWFFKNMIGISFKKV